MTVVKFIVPVKPTPKGRPRLGGTRVYTPRKTKVFEEQVRFLARAAFNAKGTKPLDGPVYVYLWLCFKGKNVGYNHTTPSDIDNLQKSVFDGMNGVAYKDDRQIVFVQAYKMWAEDDYVKVWISDCRLDSPC